MNRHSRVALQIVDALEVDPVQPLALLIDPPGSPV
jgi:hypothetical protein